MVNIIRKSIILFVLTSFISSAVMPPASAGELMFAPMPKPGVMVSASPVFSPAHLTGIGIDQANALKFDFLIDRGDQDLSAEQKKQEYTKLVKYFLASLTTPDGDQWVNLSPYEKDRIITDNFGKTEMGRDILAQDYFLKQITSSLAYPESGLGKKFWDKVYERAFKEFGSTDIPVSTFNKVWITPDEAVVYESGNTAYILKSHLKVMMEEDYKALAQNSLANTPGMAEKAKADAEPQHKIVTAIMKEVIIPEIEKEVNEGKSFALLRQIYSGMVLATWYKQAMKETILGKVYADQGKVKGVDQDPKANQEVYQQYLEAFKKGVYNYIKEDTDKYTQEVIPRQYFSGGFDRAQAKIEVVRKGSTKGFNVPIGFKGSVKRETLDRAVFEIKGSFERPFQITTGGRVAPVTVGGGASLFTDRAQDLTSNAAMLPQMSANELTDVLKARGITPGGIFTLTKENTTLGRFLADEGPETYSMGAYVYMIYGNVIGHLVLTAQKRHLNAIDTANLLNAQLQGVRFFLRSKGVTEAELAGLELTAIHAADDLKDTGMKSDQLTVLLKEKKITPEEIFVLTKENTSLGRFLADEGPETYPMGAYLYMIYGNATGHVAISARQDALTAVETGAMLNARLQPVREFLTSKGVTEAELTAIELAGLRVSDSAMTMAGAQTLVEGLAQEIGASINLLQLMENSGEKGLVQAAKDISRAGSATFKEPVMKMKELAALILNLTERVSSVTAGLEQRDWNWKNRQAEEPTLGWGWVPGEAQLAQMRVLANKLEKANQDKALVLIRELSIVYSGKTLMSTEALGKVVDKILAATKSIEALGKNPVFKGEITPFVIFTRDLEFLRAVGRGDEVRNVIFQAEVIKAAQKVGEAVMSKSTATYKPHGAERETDAMRYWYVSSDPERGDYDPDFAVVQELARQLRSINVVDNAQVDAAMTMVQAQALVEGLAKDIQNARGLLEAMGTTGVLGLSTRVTEIDAVLQEQDPVTKMKKLAGLILQLTTSVKSVTAMLLEREGFQRRFGGQLHLTNGWVPGDEKVAQIRALEKKLEQANEGRKLELIRTFPVVYDLNWKKLSAEGLAGLVSLIPVFVPMMNALKQNKAFQGERALFDAFQHAYMLLLAVRSGDEVGRAHMEGELIQKAQEITTLVTRYGGILSGPALASAQHLHYLVRSIHVTDSAQAVDLAVAETGKTQRQEVVNRDLGAVPDFVNGNEKLVTDLIYFYLNPGKFLESPDDLLAKARVAGINETCLTLLREVAQRLGERFIKEEAESNGLVEGSYMNFRVSVTALHDWGIGLFNVYITALGTTEAMGQENLGSAELSFDVERADYFSSEVVLKGSGQKELSRFDLAREYAFDEIKAAVLETGPGFSSPKFTDTVSLASKEEIKDMLQKEKITHIWLLTTFASDVAKMGYAAAKAYITQRMRETLQGDPEARILIVGGSTIIGGVHLMYEAADELEPELRGRAVTVGLLSGMAYLNATGLGDPKSRPTSRSGLGWHLSDQSRLAYPFYKTNYVTVFGNNWEQDTSIFQALAVNNMNYRVEGQPVAPFSSNLKEVVVFAAGGNGQAMQEVVNPLIHGGRVIWLNGFLTAQGLYGMAEARLAAETGNTGHPAYQQFARELQEKQLQLEEAQRLGQNTEAVKLQKRINVINKVINTKEITGDVGGRLEIVDLGNVQSDAAQVASARDVMQKIRAEYGPLVNREMERVLQGLADAWAGDVQTSTDPRRVIALVKEAARQSGLDKVNGKKFTGVRSTLDTYFAPQAERAMNGARNRQEFMSIAAATNVLSALEGKAKDAGVLAVRIFLRTMDSAQAEVVDNAANVQQQGGIDLNQANMNLQIKRDGNGVPLPLAQQDMKALMKIEGFVPVLIEIQPAAGLPIFSELEQEMAPASSVS